MAKASKPKKERADKYESKLAINTTFDNVIGLSLKGADEAAKKKVAAKKATK
jgi:hypothetical protein